jgi:hypothetical protein
MLNHFRTTLLNLSYFEPSEHIPEEFSAKKLPNDLQKIYDKLFPPKSSRFYRLFLVTGYLKMIDTVGLTNYVLALDNRISYELDTKEYFKIHRRSNTVVSEDNGFALNVLTKFGTVTYNNYNHDTFLIEQVNDTNQIRIFSRIKNMYVKDKEEYKDKEDSDAYITVTFEDSSTSNIIQIGQTGVTFNFVNIGQNDFTATGDKSWEFIIESPYTVDLLSVIRQLESTDPFKTLNKYNNNLNELEEMWLSEFNSIYKFAALLVAFTYTINNL